MAALAAPGLGVQRDHGGVVECSHPLSLLARRVWLIGRPIMEGRPAGATRI